MKRYATLTACVLMLVFLGTNQAWSVFVNPLRGDYGFSAFQMQLVFNTGTFCFCTMIIVAGRLHDRFGPRPLAAASALLIGLAWTLAWLFAGNYFMLWFALGVLAATGSAVGYVCPLATGLKWFPNHQGLVSGLTAAGFAGGPIVLATIAETLMRGGTRPAGVFALVAVIYAPAILLAGMMLKPPPGQPDRAEILAFRRRTLFRDRRFLALFVGMLTGTLPFLVVMGNAKPLAVDFGYPEALAAMAVPLLAAGNAFGRGFWGLAIDRIGSRRCMLGAQCVMMLAVAALTALGGYAAVFFGSALAIGFCYGSNFAIYPATVSRLYGTHLLGSVYPFIMAAQGISSLGPTVNGLLKDATGSNQPGLAFALAVAAAGSAACAILTRPAADQKAAPTAFRPEHLGWALGAAGPADSTTNYEPSAPGFDSGSSGANLP